MIQINRGKEPPALEMTRNAELKRLKEVVQLKRLPPSKKDIGTRYQSVKNTLWRAQHYKCCYCEMKEQLDRNDVEHFRPKTKANRDPGSAEQHGYWWLAWSWENLLFSCRNCNQISGKGTRFPLTEGSLPLQAEEQPPGHEQPLVIDPAKIQGTDHIEYVLGRRGDWSPRARNGSPLGDWTIRVCNLDRPGLIDLYTSHVKKFVQGYVEKIEKAFDNGGTAAVMQQWHHSLDDLLAPWQPFVGLSFDALNHFIPVAKRNQWNLDLELPTAEETTK